YKSWANLGVASFLLGEATTGEHARRLYREAESALMSSLQVAPGIALTRRHLAVTRQRLEGSGQN
ncbi:MAG: hypothetical protein M8861_05170, partial [marine benthic group bacterium]|nr:hypothetical protein [Gemmatimonadota bacterium]